MACALAVSASGPAQSNLVQSPVGDVSFVTRHWHSGNGLPQNTVNTIVQARDGLVWIATLGGLCSFDGERMRVFDPVTTPALHSSRFTCLAEADDGTLWVGADIGGVNSLRDGVFTHHPEVKGEYALALATSADGCVFAATDAGLFVRRTAGFERVVDPSLGRVRMLQRARSGTIYLSDERALYRWDGEVAQRIVAGEVNCVAEIGSRLVVGTHKGLFRVDSDGMRPWRPAPGLEQAVMAMTSSRDGSLWVGTWMRTHRLAPSVLLDRELPEPPAAMAPLLPAYETQATRALFEDRDGGMWLGHTERGLMRLSPADVVSHGLSGGLPQRNLASVCGDGRGGVLVTTLDGLFERKGRVFERDPAFDAFAPLRTMTVDADGALWVVGEPGLVCRDQNGCRLVAPRGSWPVNHTVALSHGPDGVLWLGGDGLACLQGSEVVVPTFAEAFRTRAVRTIAFAPDGAMWLGCTDGLARVELPTGSVREWRAGRELPYGQVRSVLPEVGENAWIATYGGGIVRVAGSQCTSVDERHGLHDQHLCGMDVLGDQFVVASNRGICLVDRRETASVVAGHAANVACRLLGTPGGGPAEMHGGFQSCIASIDGVFWFVGIDGLYELDPVRLTPPQRDLPTHVQELVVGDRRLQASESIEPAPGIRSLTVRLGTCAFDPGEQVRFRWRVAGVRDEWSAPTYDRDVRLVDLPPGDHVFEASTVDVSGTPANHVLRLRLHLPLEWWEAAWVRPVGFATAAALAFLLVRLGARRAASRAARLEALVDERTSELVAAQQHLEQRVADRTAELREALARQEAAQHEQQSLERQLQRMQRMESVGQLAGGIAHDFNNLLTVVQGASELLVGEDSPREREELCSAIAQASQRGRNLTQHLLAVASRQHVVTERLDLARVVADLQPVLKSLLGDAIALRLEAPVSAPVRAAVTQIEQILLNLCANARDAMPHGGEVLVTIVATDCLVRLEVRDNGIGMTAEVVERAFEPFFSTKGRGGTRGLGLATVYGIAKQLNGQARIDSAPGAGAAVTIELPRDTSTNPGPTVLTPQRTPGRVEARVLLIEDEDAVRATIRRLLQQLGCTVEATADGSSALQALRASPQDFDVVLSDVVMPGLHGRPLLDALRSVRADLPIVFVSGYLDGRLTHRDLADAGLEILAKPIDRERLAAALLRAMARQPAATRDAE